MPYLNSIQDWLRQSDLLIRAYPTSTRITTKYSIPSPSSSPSRKRKRPINDNAAGDASATTDKQQPKGLLTLKTYDPVSGACLKYKTDQAAEANRLVRSLGALGKGLAGMSVDVESVLDGPVGEQQQEAVGATVGGVGGAGKDGTRDGGKGESTASAAAGAEGSGKRKKKKGKK